MQTPDTKTQNTKQQDKETKRAQALRDNLKRRKSQERDRREQKGN